MGFRRYTYPGQTYFFTVVIADRYPVFTTEESVSLLRICIQNVQARHPFRIDAAVILPDHIHMLWTLPDNDGDHSVHWRLIKTQFRQRAGLGAIWQPRYWGHMIRDDSDLERHTAYIHWNPVKHGLVDDPRDWPWSSVHRHTVIGVAPEMDHE